MIESATSPEAACISCGGGPILVKKRQLCRPCYCRWQKYGDPGDGRLRRGMPPLERFNHYVPDQSDPLGCWIWTGPTLGRDICDYGRLWVGEDAIRYMLAHRWAYEHFVEPIPDGLEIDHVKARGCQSTLCCNPAHLQPVPHKINLERGDGAGARNAAKECCPKCGGDYEVTDDGKRFCRPCRRATGNEWWRENHGTGEGSGSRNRGKTHCDNGHEFTEENTYIPPPTKAKPNPRRDCKICRGDRRNKSAAKMRAQKQAA